MQLIKTLAVVAGLLSTGFAAPAPTKTQVEGDLSLSPQDVANLHAFIDKRTPKGFGKGLLNVLIGGSSVCTIAGGCNQTPRAMADTDLERRDVIAEILARHTPDHSFNERDVVEIIARSPKGFGTGLLNTLIGGSSLCTIAGGCNQTPRAVADPSLHARDTTEFETRDPKGLGKIFGNIVNGLVAGSSVCTIAGGCNQTPRAMPEINQYKRRVAEMIARTNGPQDARDIADIHALVDRAPKGFGKGLLNVLIGGSSACTIAGGCNQTPRAVPDASFHKV